LTMRHAQAEEIRRNQFDRDRKLTRTGQQEAKQMASRLFDQNISIDAVYTSSSVRTQQTTSALSNALNLNNSTIFSEDDLYNASVPTLLSFIVKINNAFNTVLMVGHNPTISYLPEYLSNVSIGSMPTAGICIVRFNAGSWGEVTKGSGELIEFVYPDLLK